MDIKTENWNGHDIRFVHHGEEWKAIAKDVAEALGYRDTNSMTRHLKSKYLTYVRLTGVNQKFIAITEQGVYKAVTRSQRPEAESFEDWIFDTVKQLRMSSGLEGFQVFRMLDTDHQNQCMEIVKQQLGIHADKKHYIKANTVANKAVSNKYGHPKMLKKEAMTPEMLRDRQPVLEEAAQLTAIKEAYGLDFSVSKAIYSKYSH